METMERTRSLIDSERIGSKFSKACSTYNRSAIAQRKIADRLALLLRDYMEQSSFYPYSALEIGCGTGLLTRHLQQLCPSAWWTLNDLYSACAEKALSFCRQGTRFVCADASEVDWNESFQLIASSSVFQWIPNQKAFYKRLAACQKEGDVLLFSSFLPGNFSEIYQLTHQGLLNPDRNDLKSWLEPYYQIQTFMADEIRLYFPSPKDVLLHLKETGVTANHSGFWTPGRFRTFSDAYYEHFSNEQQQVSLTYKPVYVLAVKK